MVELSIALGSLSAVSSPSAAATSAETPLVIAAQRGDRSAFSRLYGIYARMVHGILLSRIPRIDVEDLTQDVFLQALRKLATLRDPAAFGPWIGMIARNRANDYHRHSRETTELPEDLSAQRHPEGEAMTVLAIIRSLPSTYSETLTLRLVEGMTGPEIALRTGLKPASVRVNLHRGMRMLRERLGARQE